MKLYYSPGACSLSPHIALEEAGLPYEAVLAPTKTKTLPDGSDYRKINPLGYVPYLVLDDGTGLPEGPAIVQYIADQAPAKRLAPPNGSLARYRLQSWLNFIGTELHKGFGPLFNPASPDEVKAAAKERLATRLKWVDEQLAGKTWLMGDDFGVADGYLFTVTNWAKPMQIDLSPYPNLEAWRARVAARPAVQAAMKAEGLLG
ncbi:MAG: glutathione transferase GstA [Burkholderiaceae bacterium]|uniref:glutathione transferase GstA n=1 Tax=Ottowia sp. TaxID=1898956 RepID=UPI001D9ED114|nr:glutathione transferase GstA [Ottowia sp.]MCP5259563.1 glutathione transferase GstA [Burkholderiaceae bacterium]MCB2025126.1 glutathione transferase GstA [Ottowia sp.]MCB2033153.1 glutathione transferase GstA [Ottowia sp.]MCB2035957.1 glutathione transferase GstA [Ottowia sp.]HPR43610.1 glutathione transferase GstA [Ottowia sp.]